ncbi:MAG: hypothetical protein P4N60_01015 [Verrucomicrobiae bacterium]|nr:hypothetical protein [Verrucomicrobiae bacterium]
MSEASANLPAIKPAGPPAGEGWPAGPRSDVGWSRKKILFLIALAVIVHVALIVAFGTKKPFIPKPVTGVPHLQFGNQADELLELDNPALFALPNPRDFAAAVWQKPPAITPPSFRWQPVPGELPQPATNNLGAAFARFMQTNQFGDFPLDFKPPPLFVELTTAFNSVLPPSSLLQISGALAQRTLLARPALPSLDWNDVIAPSKVQVTVDQAGNVLSAVLLPADNAIEAAGRSPKGDTNAVALALSLKFAPATQLALGEITFYWHTTPLTTTNAPNQP